MYLILIYIRSAFDIAWTTILLKKEPPEYLQRLQVLFREEHRLEDWDLTNAQKVVLGIIYTDFEKELRSPDSIVNARDVFGHTALWWAAMKGDADLVSTLHFHGADHNIADEVGITPIHAAVQSGSIEVVKLLLQFGADAAAADSWGSTTLMSVIWHNDRSLIDLLHDNGVDIEAREKCLGQTALSFAAKTNQVGSVKFLLQLHAELDAQDNYGDSPLFLSILGKCPNTTQFLVEAGANLGLRNRLGQTILHYAARYGTEATLRALGSRGLSGLDVYARDKDGKTAEELFKQDNHEGDSATEAFFALIEMAQSSRMAETVHRNQEHQSSIQSRHATEDLVKEQIFQRSSSPQEEIEGLTAAISQYSQPLMENRIRLQRKLLFWAGGIVFAFIALWLALYPSHLPA